MEQTPSSTPVRENPRQTSKLFTHYSKSRDQQEKVSIKWEDISYAVVGKDPSKSTFLRPVYKNKHILRNLSGSAVSGELLAIMGPTGCATIIITLDNCLTRQACVRLWQDKSVECVGWACF